MLSTISSEKTVLTTGVGKMEPPSVYLDKSNLGVVLG